MTSRYSSLKKMSIILGLVIGAGAVAGGLYSGAVWASTRQSVDQCEIEADAAEAGAIEAVRVHQSLEAQIHETMIQRMDHHEDTIERHEKQIDKTNTEILYILREWRRNGHP